MSVRDTGDGKFEALARGGRPGQRGWALLLLAIPFVALLYPPFYARITPELWGIPFFIWYQFAWIILGSALTAVVYVIRR
jgi:hypothetical protein